MMICPVCTENYTKKSREPIECPECKYVCCKACVETFLINDTSADTICMNCREPLVYDLSSGFLKKREEAVWLHEERASLQVELKRYNYSKETKLITQKLNEEIAELESRIREIKSTIRNVEESVSHSTLTIMCPSESCKGYVNEASGVCHLCQISWCMLCLKPNTDTHTCNADDVLSVSLIREHTKPCPNCRTLIQRISGCPTMYCVVCKRGFNWNKGEVARKVRVSNPEFHSDQIAHFDVSPRDELVHVEFAWTRIRAHYLNASYPDLRKIHTDFLAQKITESQWEHRIITAKRRSKILDTFRSILVKYNDRVASAISTSDKNDLENIRKSINLILISAGMNKEVLDENWLTLSRDSDK
jgi:hypothetical protein